MQRRNEIRNCAGRARGRTLVRMNWCLGKLLACTVSDQWSVALRRHFGCAWFHSMPSGPSRKTAVVPDACADLIWFGGALLVAGTDRAVGFEPVPPGTTVLDLSFQPCSVATWLGLPAALRSIATRWSHSQIRS